MYNQFNSFNPAAFPQTALPVWTEHAAADGKKYYHNRLTNETTWNRPPELAPPTMVSCPWKQYFSPDGKPYYYNTMTKQSVWEKPADFVESDVKVSAVPATPLTPKETNNESEIERAMKATLSEMAIPEPEEIEIPVYKSKAEMAEALRQLLRDKLVPGDSTWDAAVKLIVVDPRYEALKNFSEKKQIFNVYKTQRQKEERDEQRLRLKRAKEDLEKFLLEHPKVHSTMSFRQVDQLLKDESVWKAVPASERREIFLDVSAELAKKEKEEAKVLRKRNLQVFGEILLEIETITHETTWEEAQVMLLENKRFNSDTDIQSLDKDDALIVFGDHIRDLEQQHDEERDRLR
ncbi:hypothetical protein Ciccas_013361, partial [Cichlidogyrus casuarinus]